MRLAAHADVGYLRVDQAYYRRHDNNMSRELSNRLVTLNELRSAYEALLERCGEILSNAAELSQMIHRRLAWEALWAAARAYDRKRTDTVPVEGLAAFAFDCWPDAARLSTYRGLQLRRRIGPALMPYLQPLIWSAVVRHLQDRWRWHRRELHGI
jgi:hypothetical protein